MGHLSSVPMFSRACKAVEGTSSVGIAPQRYQEGWAGHPQTQARKSDTKAAYLLSLSSGDPSFELSGG